MALKHQHDFSLRNRHDLRSLCCHFHLLSSPASAEPALTLKERSKIILLSILPTKTGSRGKPLTVSATFQQSVEVGFTPSSLNLGEKDFPLIRRIVPSTSVTLYLVTFHFTG